MNDDTRLAWLLSLVPYAKQAKDCWPKMWVSVCLAQAAIESGWGARPIGGWNLWGLKNLEWNPGEVDVPTHEYVNGRLVPVIEHFEDAATPEEGFAIYGRLVNNAKPYAEARTHADLEGYVMALAHAWNRNPAYGPDILKIIAEYDLTLYDTKDEVSHA